MARDARRQGQVAALGAALLWALSTPFSKVLLEDVAPLPLAGLCYLGAAAGLLMGRLVLGRTGEARLGAKDSLPLLAVALAGGVLAPAALLHGLSKTPASVAALLCSTEGVLTILLAALLFREAIGRRMWAAAILLAVGAMLLAFTPGIPGAPEGSNAAGACLVVLASALWALDSNLTRLLAHKDPIEVAAAKGLLAGPATLLLCGVTHQRFPGLREMAAGLALGAITYGCSLVLYVRALRLLGTARTAALFGIAPFLGAIVSLPLLSEALTARLLMSGVLMGAASILVLSEEHGHLHAHEPLEHDHAHVHDAHHQHAHDGDSHPEPHSHVHRHEPLVHAHPHVPDIHHRHRH